MLVDLARNDVGSGRQLRHRADGRADDARALLPRDAPHEPGRRRARRRRNAVDVLRATFPAGTVSGAPKVRAMEIIDELEPVEARRRTRAWSATSTSPATSTPRSRSARWCGATARRACRRAPGSSPTRSPPTKTWNATTRRGRCSPQPPRRERLAPLGDRRERGHERETRRRARRAAPGCRHRRPVRSGLRDSSPVPTRCSFLQALVSADLDPLQPGMVHASLLLTPQGKLDVDFRLLVVGDEAVARLRPRARRAAQGVARRGSASA